VATSLGAGKVERAIHQERLAIVFATLLCAGLSIPGFVFAPEVVTLFNPEPGLVDWAVTYVRTMVVAFIFTPINIVISQAMVAHARLKTPVIVDSIVLLGIMTPIMIIGTLAGASVQFLIIVNAVTVITLTVIYVAIRWKQGTRGDEALARANELKPPT
jgi:Na+-driven multidrug efflux pump